MLVVNTQTRTLYSQSKSSRKAMLPYADLAFVVIGLMAEDNDAGS